MKQLKINLLMILLATILAACGGAVASESGKPAATEQAVGQAENVSKETPQKEGVEATDATATQTADKATAEGFPVTVTMCGEPVTFEAPPQRAVTNDVNITEIFLDVGLKDKLIGYSGVSDTREVAPEYREMLKGIPLLSDKYIDLEALVGAEPDFFFAGWNYGFSEEKGMTPESLARYGIKSYVLTESCIRIKPREQISLEDTFSDMLNIGQIFGVEAQARAKVEQYRAQLAEIKAAIGQVDKPIRVFVYDSGEESPFTAGKFAMPNAMIEAAGGVNIFNDVDTSWTTVNWEDVLNRNPEYIVIVDYGEPDAPGKINFLKSKPQLAAVEAIKNNKFVVLTYAEATPGPRNVARTRTLAEAFYPEKFE